MPPKRAARRRAPAAAPALELTEGPGRADQGAIDIGAAQALQGREIRLHPRCPFHPAGNLARERPRFGRRQAELLHSLLFTLPGTPILYYGDEIGMGDNIYLGDRNGVRTPMQWSADRNAGFSRANAQGLYLPVIIDPEYRYESVNVEAQEQSPSSLLWFTKRLIALRKRYQAFGRGSVE
mgnify:CR=1 FL=1